MIRRDCYNYIYSKGHLPYTNIADIKLDQNMNSILHTVIYQYHIQHLENLQLSDIILRSVTYSHGIDVIFMYHCYVFLMDNNILDILYETIGKSVNEDIIILLVAIDKSQIDVLNILISNGFNLNQLIFPTGKHIYFPLMHAIRVENLPMIKYLIEKGADPFQYDGIAFIKSCDTYAIFEYFIELDVSNKYLSKLFYHIISHESFTNVKIRKILERGFIIENIDQFIENYNGVFTVAMIEFLSEMGYTLNFDKLMNIQLGLTKNGRYRTYDSVLIKFLLEHGTMPDSKVIQRSILTIDIWLIKLFLEHDIDFTIASEELSSKKDKYRDLINKIKNNMDQDLLIVGLITRCIDL
jgi:hypothetical protein